jgi:competence protein ComEC
MATGAGSEDLDLKHPAPGLYAWQLCLGAAVCGLFAAQDVAPALAGLVLLAFLVRLWRPAGPALWRLALAFVLGAAVAYLATPGTPELPQLVGSREKVELTGRVVSVRSRPEKEIQVVLEALTIRPADAEGEATVLPGRLAWTWKYPQGRPAPGQLVRLTTRLWPQRGFLNEGGWETAAYWARQGVFSRAFTWGEHDPVSLGPAPEAPLWSGREQVRERLLAATEPGRGQALLLALLLGDRFLLDQVTIEDMTAASLAHSLALSGLHLGLVTAIGFGLAWLLGRLRPRLLLACPRRKLGVLLAAPLCVAYLWLGGGSASLIRATVMFAAFAFMLWRGRSGILLDGLFWALVAILAVSPLSVFDLGLQLSVLAVTGIALLWPWWRRLTQRILPDPETRPRLNRLLATPLGLVGVSLAANLASQPLVLGVFGRLPLGLPWNLVWLPLLGLAVMPLGFLGLGLALLPGGKTLAGLVLGLDARIIEAFLDVLHWAGAHGLTPVAVGLRPSWPAVLGYYLLALWLLYGGRDGRRRALLIPALAVCLLLAPQALRALSPEAGGVTLTVLDVGQGQSLLIGTPSGRRYLFDGGGTGSPTFDIGEAVVGPVLTSDAQPAVDGVLMSHPENDHAQGLGHIVKCFRVGFLADNGRRPEREGAGAVWAAAAPRGVPVRRLAAGDVLDLGDGLALHILHPPEEFKTADENEASMVGRLVWRGRGLALLPGDLGPRGMKALLKGAADLSASVLVLPHHGSDGSASSEFYARVSPSRALASAGAGNQFGFPGEKVRALLDAAGCPLTTTAEAGMIRVSWLSPEAAPRLWTYLPAD